MHKKVAVITGASSGIGRAIVGALESERGWEIITPSHAELDLNDLSLVAAYGSALKRRVASILSSMLLPYGMTCKRYGLESHSHNLPPSR